MGDRWPPSFYFMIDSPVISSGWGRFITLSIVGTMSQSLPPSLSSTSPQLTQINGTRFVVWAVNGEPSASIITSALPWSAVTKSVPPFSITAS